MVEPRTLNPYVVGSNPTRHTNIFVDTSSESVYIDNISQRKYNMAMTLIFLVSVLIMVISIIRIAFKWDGSKLESFILVDRSGFNGLPLLIVVSLVGGILIGAGTFNLLTWMFL